MTEEEAVPEVEELPTKLFPAQRRAMEKTLATIERLHKEAEAGQIKTISRKEVVNYGWHPNTGIVYTIGGTVVGDRISGLWARFEGSKLSPIGKLRGSDADPWIYFTRGNKKYRTPLYTDPTMSGSEKLVSKLKEPAVFTTWKAEVLPVSLVEYDRRYTLKELREMARQVGLSPSGSKKGIAAKLIAKGIR